MKLLNEAIADADEVEVDSLWAILKYKDFGVLRKLKCMALILDLDEEAVINEASKDESGRILDKETRNSIHESLIKKSKQQ